MIFINIVGLWSFATVEQITRILTEKNAKLACDKNEPVKLPKIFGVGNLKNHKSSLLAGIVKKPVTYD